MALSPPAASRLDGGIRYSVQPLAGSPPAPLLIQDPFTPTSAYCSVSSGAAVFALRVIPVVVKLTEQENGCVTCPHDHFSGSLPLRRKRVGKASRALSDADLIMKHAGKTQ